MYNHKNIFLFILIFSISINTLNCTSIETSINKGLIHFKITWLVTSEDKIVIRRTQKLEEKKEWLTFVKKEAEKTRMDPALYMWTDKLKDNIRIALPYAQIVMEYQEAQERLEQAEQAQQERNNAPFYHIKKKTGIAAFITFVIACAIYDNFNKKKSE